MIGFTAAYAHTLSIIIKTIPNKYKFLWESIIYSMLEGENYADYRIDIGEEEILKMLISQGFTIEEIDYPLIRIRW